MTRKLMIDQKNTSLNRQHSGYKHPNSDKKLLFEDEWKTDSDDDEDESSEEQIPDLYLSDPHLNVQPATATDLV